MPNEAPNQTIERAKIEAVGETMRNNPEIEKEPFAERMESMKRVVGQKQDFIEQMRLTNPDLSQEQLDAALRSANGQLDAGQNIAEELGEGENVQALEQIKTSSEKGVLNHLWKYKWRYVIGAAALAAMIYGGYYAWMNVPGVATTLSNAWEYLGLQYGEMQKVLETWGTVQGGTPIAEGLGGSTGGPGVVLDNPAMPAVPIQSTPLASQPMPPQ